RIDERVLKRPQRPAQHDGGDPRRRRLELERRLEAVGEDDHVVELGSGGDRTRRCSCSRADVDDHRLPVLEQGRGCLSDRDLLGREARDAVLERLLLPRRQARDRAAADAVDLPSRGERVEVSAHGHLRHAEPAAQLGDAHELPLLDLGQHALAPKCSWDRRLFPVVLHGRGASCGSATVKSVSSSIGSAGTASAASRRAASSGATSLRKSPSPVSTLARIFVMPGARCSGYSSNARCQSCSSAGASCATIMYGRGRSKRASYLRTTSRSATARSRCSTGSSSDRRPSPCRRARTATSNGQRAANGTATTKLSFAETTRSERASACVAA